MSVAVTKDAIKEAVENVPNEQLEALYRHVKELARSNKKKISRETFMEKMRKVRIDAPPDFSRNLDLYMNGEKTIE